MEELVNSIHRRYWGLEAEATRQISSIQSRGNKDDPFLLAQYDLTEP